MSGINPKEAAKKVSEYKKAVMDEIESRCIKYCDQLCLEAIEHRQSAPGKHNFTGNLINSIVTCVYREKKPVYACYAGDSLPQAIQVKMTYPNQYHFDRDYEGGESNFKPDVKTDQGWGEDDAKRFFQTYRPSGDCIFNIVVAYPVEYASFVEARRKTTGIIGTWEEAKRISKTYLCLNK